MKLFRATSRPRRRAVAIAAMAAAAITASVGLAATPALAVSTTSLTSTAQNPFGVTWWAIVPVGPSGPAPVTTQSLGFDSRADAEDGYLNQGAIRSDMSDGIDAPNPHLQGSPDGLPDLSFFDVEGSVTVSVEPTPGAQAQLYQAYSLVDWDWNYSPDSSPELSDPSCLQSQASVGPSLVMGAPCNQVSENQANQQWIPVQNNPAEPTEWTLINVAAIQANGDVLSTAPRLTITNQDGTTPGIPQPSGTVITEIPGDLASQLGTATFDFIDEGSGLAPNGPWYYDNWENGF